MSKSYAGVQASQNSENSNNNKANKTLQSSHNKMTASLTATVPAQNNDPKILHANQTEETYLQQERSDVESQEIS